MATDQTGTYSEAKHIFNSLGLKKEVYLPLNEKESKVFRKHLLEMVKRKSAPYKYVTRLSNKGLMVMRIE